jgi:wyosine [tRNA(Phe)-imidazoG37] synthetase (radical SAM superfamily)
MTASASAIPVTANPGVTRPAAVETAFGCPRDFLGKDFVYVVFSPRARGLSIGVNLNPDKYCNFDCAYCEVNRQLPSRHRELKVDVMARELEETLALVDSGQLRRKISYQNLSNERLRLRHVALSGDGEPTLSPRFVEAVETVAHVRAVRPKFFKIVLITNGSGLDLPPVQKGLKLFTQQDEIWVKLDAGTQAYMNRVNQPQVPLEKILSNLLLVARQRPIVIQSLFPLLNGREPAPEEIEQYVQRLNELKMAGANISLVQVYSSTRPTTNSECEHLPLRTLSHIAQRVRQETGLTAEAF